MVFLLSLIGLSTGNLFFLEREDSSGFLTFFAYYFSVMSTIGQIVVDGRIYPSQSVSPSTSIPPHGSPSPGHTRPPQQQSPINQLLQQQSPTYQQSSGYQQSPRLPPPYGQFSNGTQYQQGQNMSPQPNMQQPMGGKIVRTFVKSGFKI